MSWTRVVWSPPSPATSCWTPSASPSFSQSKGGSTMSDWLATSYMARKGVAQGKAGTTHQLTEARQGKYHYVYGPYADPVLHIKPGDLVVAETKDAFEGAITSVDDQPTKLL